MFEKQKQKIAKTSFITLFLDKNGAEKEEKKKILKVKKTF